MADDERLTPHIALPPEDLASLAGFPESVLRYGRSLWRVHRRELEPSQPGHGDRFGLLPKRGTCYLAGDEMTAIAETLIRGSSAIDASDLEERVIRQMPLHKDFRLADTKQRMCSRFGITRELSTISDYILPKLWAESLANAGFDGIVYWPRFDMPETAMNVAIFGRQGERRRWHRRLLGLLSSDGWRKRITADTGVAILDMPASSEFQFDEAF